MVPRLRTLSRKFLIFHQDFLSNEQASIDKSMRKIVKILTKVNFRFAPASHFESVSRIADRDEMETMVAVCELSTS